MPIGLDDGLQELAELVTALADRHTPTTRTREVLSALAAGDPGPGWQAWVDHDLHALHLPEDLGGSGAGLMEVAVVAEAAGRRLVPGPWTATVLAGRVAQLAGRDDVVRRLVAGATGAVVLHGLSAVRDGAGWRVQGTSAPTLSLPGAEVVLARAAGPDGPVWFVVPEPVAVETADPVDLTRSAGRLVVGDLPLPADAVLEGVADAEVERWAATLLAAESAGVAAWALETGVEHLQNRHQFGRPLGSFQVLQHRAATMLVRKEAAVAAAWEAARLAEAVGSDERGADRRTAAAAQAVLTALGPAVDVAFDLVTLLGALGITWEHDTHLYERRALANAAWWGDADTWARRLGEVTTRLERVNGIGDPDVLPDLREQVGRTLDEVAALPHEPAHDGPWGTWTGGPRQDLLADAGLVAPHLPPPYGLGAGPQEQGVIAHEFSRRGLTQPTLVVGDWFLATLVAHGTPAQQERFADPTLRGALVWCQLFSEPEAGSDLASLRTRAVRTEGGWLLQGQKVWNSRACEADWGVCLARTDPDVPKHRGLTYFLVDMRSPGLDRRPIRHADGKADLAEVFLDEVFVPDDCVLGEPGQGWQVAVATLANERLNMGNRPAYGSTATVTRLVGDLPEERRDQGVRLLGETAARETAIAALSMRAVEGLAAGRDMAATLSVNKVLNSSVQREGAREIVRLLGTAGAVTDGRYVTEFLGMPAMLFGGGTPEVQLNVIATRLLGLPR